MRLDSLLILTPVMCGCQSSPPQPSTAEDEAAVREVLAGLERAWNARDLDATAALVEEEVVSISPDREQISEGKHALRSNWERFHSQTSHEWRPTIRRVWISGDLAVAYGIATNTTSPIAGGDTTHSTDKNMWVFRRSEDGRWRYLAEIWN